MTTDDFIALVEETYGVTAAEDGAERLFACDEETLIHLRILPQSEALFLYRLLETRQGEVNEEALTEQTLCDLERAAVGMPFTCAVDESDTYRQLQWHLFPAEWSASSARKCLEAFRNGPIDDL